MSVKVSDSAAGQLVGNLRVRSVPATVSVEDALSSDVGSVLLDQKNMVVKTAETGIIGVLKGDMDYAPAYLVIGDGGDLEQISRVDSGARIGPTVDDTAMRSIIAKIPIVQVTDQGNDCWTYAGVARPHEAISPMINEFGVESINGVLYSHFVSEPNAAGRSTRYCKTPLEYLIIEWEYCFTLAFVDTTDPFNTAGATDTQQVFLFTQSLNLEGRTTAEAIARAIAGSTDISLLSQDITGAVASIDVQTNTTVLSQDVTGASAVIHLVVI